jgi:hypothetical protein
MADAADSKSVARKGVWVQVPPLVLSFFRKDLTVLVESFLFEKVIHQINRRFLSKTPVCAAFPLPASIKLSCDYYYARADLSFS